MSKGKNALSTAPDSRSGPRPQRSRWSRFTEPEPGMRDSVTRESLAELGINLRTGWYVAAFLYSTGGLIFTALWLADVVPAKTGMLGVTAMALAVVFAACAHLAPDAPWGGHVLIGAGLLIITYGGYVDGDKHSAFALLLMWPVLVPVYLFAWRLSVPYLIAGTISSVVLILVISDPTAYAIVIGTMFLAIGLTTVAAQNELRRMSRINSELAITDPLTGIANMRRLMERMRDAIALADRGGDPPALFALDLDDFKQVNDRFGHGRGDELLCAVAEAVSEAIDAGDLVARRGGDEFAVLAIDRHGRDLEELRERIEQAVHDARERVCPQVTTTATVGLALHHPADEPADLLARGDEELHERKLDLHGHVSEVSVLTADTELEHHRARLARRGPAHQASHAMQGSSDEAMSDLAMARSIKRVLGNALCWEMIAAINAFMTAAVAGVMFTETGAELVKVVPIAATAGILTLALVAVLANYLEAGEQALHAVLGLTVLCVTVIVYSSHALRASMVDLYLGPMVCAFYAFTARRAFVYYWICIALYSAALITADYAFIPERIGMTVSVTLVMVTMLGKARRNVAAYSVNAVKLSVVDPLTGAINLRGLRRTVADAIERSVGGELTPSLIPIDLDEFKLVNDRYGHSTGDRMLKAVTSAMHEALRGGDQIARRGGDEFAAVCLVNGPAEANALAARLAECIARARLEICPALRPTATVSVVLWRPGEDTDAFLARADSELHGAKEISHAERAHEYVARAS